MTIAIFGLSAVVIALISSLIKISKQNTSYKNQIYKMRNKISESDKELKDYRRKDDSSKLRIQKLEKYIQEKDALFENLADVNETSLTHLSILYADHLTLQYSLAEKHFSWSRSKVNIEKTIKIRELKALTKEHIARYKLMEYKYAYLLTIFPELEAFTDDINNLKEYNSEFNKNLKELRDDFDRTLFFLSKEEYDQLTEEQRNQLALDRYIKGKKSNWQIGRDYEMYIGYCYEKENYNVAYFGIENTLNDLGRDIVATKGSVTKIIQCKYWSQEKQIREKHIAQLYGTTIQYMLFNKHSSNTVIPVLVTNTKLSDTAKEFAEYLKVEYIENKAIGDFPRIKCNTNRDLDGYETKIYHLPFDQQYDRTKINRRGDFYAFTVDEAMRSGFRRARRWFGQ